MEWWLGGLIVGVLFVLRLAVPLGIVALIGYGVRRLDGRWHPVPSPSGGE